MTPQLQQAIKLLALSNLEIEAFIGEALAGNPLLDTEPAVEPGPAAREAVAGAGNADGPEAGNVAADELAPDEPTADALMLRGQGEADAPLDLDPDALGRDRDTGDWSAAAPSAGVDGPGIEDRPGAGPSLVQHLDAQIGTVAAEAQQAAIARHIIGLLDEAGYLSETLDEVALALGVPVPEAGRALALVQTLDPAGVGARSLAECLALQAKDADRYDPCMALLIDNLEMLAKGSLAQLKRLCEVDDEDFADMLAELRGYDPRPGLRFFGSGGEPLVPDVLISPGKSEEPGGKEPGWEIAINQATLPRLVVNRAYYLELRGEGLDKTARRWLNEKLGDANWLMKALDQRQKTILKVCAEIVQQQDGFLRHGVAHLRPLTLRAVAEATDMHESTVSRATSNKYLQCPQGTFELKYFFTSGVAATDGAGAISAEAVKAQIRKLVDAEDADAVLSDDRLVELLRERGYDLARRTVAKYREAIGIGSSVQRRRQKRLARVA